MPNPADATPVAEAQKRATAENRAVVEFLRGKHGPKVRRGILNGKRVDYFKGKTAIRTILGPQYAKLKKVPAVKDEEEAKALLGKILPNAFFLRVDRPTPANPQPGQPKPLQLCPTQSLDESAYYAWFYDGSPLTTILGGAAMVVIMLAGVMFPLWPVKLRVGVWYLSILALGLLGALIVLAIIRLIFWCITVVAAPKAIWIFPNLFEDVGFFESFVPLWAYDEPKKKKKKVKGSSSSSNKKSDKGDKKKREGNDGEGKEAEGAGEGSSSSKGQSTAAQVNPSQAGLSQRQPQSATVEEIGDDDDA